MVGSQGAESAFDAAAVDGGYQRNESLPSSQMSVINLDRPSANAGPSPTQFALPHVARFAAADEKTAKLATVFEQKILAEAIFLSINPD